MKLTPERIAEIKAAWNAARDLVVEIQMSPMGSVGSFNNIYKAQLDRKQIDHLAAKLARTAIPELLADREALMDEIETMRDVCSKLVTDAIGSMERPRIFGYGHTREEIAAVDAGDIIRTLKNVVEIKIDATLTDEED